LKPRARKVLRRTLARDIEYRFLGTMTFSIPIAVIVVRTAILFSALPFLHSGLTDPFTRDFSYLSFQMSHSFFLRLSLKQLLVIFHCQ
jgi:hypothetical protein